MNKLLLALLATASILTGCGSDGNSISETPVVPVVQQPQTRQQLGFSEKDLVERPTRLVPGQTLALYREKPDEPAQEFDLGGQGSDIVPLHLPSDSTLALSGSDTEGATLRDASGRGVEAGTVLPAGDYTLELPGTGKNQFLRFGLQVEGRGAATLQLTDDAVGADLTGIDLSGRHFEMMNFSKSNLQNADLFRCRFSQCFFIETDFTGATGNVTQFEQSDMRRVVLHQTNMEVSNFLDCNLTGSNCQNSTLRGCEFKDTDLEGASFQSAQLRQCGFWNTVMTDVNFNGATLQANYMAHLDFVRVTFLGANLWANDFYKSHFFAPPHVEVPAPGQYFPDQY